MSDIVIRAEHLGKAYHITRSQGRSRYRTLREDLLALPRRLLAGLGGGERSEIFWALREVAFEVREGEVLGVIGRNGAGKSTLLKVLARITDPSEGQVELYGRVGSLLEVGTGFHPELTGRENIYLSGAILGMRRAEIARRFDEIVEFAEMQQFLDMPVKRYSSGMYMRLAFAVAAHLDPEILLVDEVLAVGDAAFQEKCLGKMDDVARGGRTVLFVSHNMAAVARLCPRALLVQRGRIVLEGPAMQVIDAYLSSPAGYAEQAARRKPLDAPAYLEAASVRNAAGEMVERVDMQEPFTVRIEYVVNQGLPNMTVAFVLADLAGNFVIDTHDADLNPERFAPRRPGRYVAELTVPGGLLNIGQYELLLFTGVPKLAQAFDSLRHLYLTVEDARGSPIYRGAPQRRSTLALALEWRVRDGAE